MRLVFLSSVLLVLSMFVVISSCGRLHPHSQAAAPCTVSSNSLGSYINCPDGSSTFVANGIDGSDGLDGSVVEFVDPCPAIVVAHPELLMKIDNILYAVYASGTKIHLTKLGPGNYATTDGRFCYFTINANGELQ